MAAPRVGPCSDWATEADLCTPCDDYTFDATLLADSLTAASEILFELSGRRFSGTCTETVRPCTRRLVETTYREHGIPLVSCGCQVGQRCGCSRLDEITLGGFPLVSVTSVRVRETVGGALETLTAGTDYRIDDYRRLVRLADANGTQQNWPCCQRLDLDAGDGDLFFDVTFTYGVDPPSSGVRAAAVLACEFALACSPETIGKCRLPKKVQEVARQGVTIALLDPTDFFADGGTGIYEIDLFLRAYNPNGLQQRAQVVSPDVPRRVRHTNT